MGNWLIRNWKPWEESTGPKSSEGKAAWSQNAYKGGVRPFLRELASLLREQEKDLARLQSVIIGI